MPQARRWRWILERVAATLAFIGLEATSAPARNPAARAIEVRDSISSNPDDDKFWGSEFAGPGQLNSYVQSLTTFRGDLIAGGWFVYAGDQVVQFIAAWNDSIWRPLGGGFTSCMGGDLCVPFVLTLTTWNDKLVAGGAFLRLDDFLGPLVNRIAMWNGHYWSGMGDGFDAGVSALAVHENQLVAGGGFTHSGGRVVNAVARWNDRLGLWEPLGSGLNGGVSSLVVYQGALIAGGNFTATGGSPTSYIARWNGTAWQPMGSGSTEAVSELMVMNDSLYATGRFRAVGGMLIRGVGWWDGTDWSPVGGDEGFASSLTSYRGKLVAGNLGTGHISRWDGMAWASLGSGVNDVVSALTVHNGSLYVGGRFTMAGGKPSQYVARWNDTVISLEVADFSVVAEASGARIRWTLGRSAIGTTRAVHVQRSFDASDAFQNLSQFPPDDREMSYLDEDLGDRTVAHYRLLLDRDDGSQYVTRPIEFTLSPATHRPELLSATFSPHDGTVEVTYRMGRQDDLAELKVFDVRGRVLRDLVPSGSGEGVHRVTWDRREGTGARAARGVYFVRLVAGPWVSRRAVVLPR